MGRTVDVLPIWATQATCAEKASAGERRRLPAGRRVREFPNGPGCVFPTRVPRRGARSPAPSRIIYVETVYAPVVRARAPYPSAMRRARRRARLTALITLTAVTTRRLGHAHPAARSASRR